MWPAVPTIMFFMAPISWYYSTSAAIALLILLSGSLVYCVLTMIAARKYLAESRPHEEVAAAISILKPLRGVDEGLADNLRSFFRQDYPNFEILLGVASVEDPAVEVARAVMAEFPAVPSHLAITGDSPMPNAKVFNLQHLLPHAKNKILVMAAILEATPAFADEFLLPPVRPLALALRVTGLGLAAVARTVFGVALLPLAARARA